jgi:hypothetical protein
MITEKDIQTRLAKILTDGGFNVVASEIDEGFAKPAVFVSVFPASARLLTSGGALEEVTDSAEIKYISADETVEDCVDTANRIKKLFFHKPFDIMGRHITIEEIEFEVEKTALYVYFDLSFIQAADTDEEYEQMENLNMEGVL